MPLRKITVLSALLIVFASSVCFAGLSANKINGKWALVGVANTENSRVEPWQYTPITWEFINQKEMKFTYGYAENDLTYTIESNDIKMNKFGVVTTYTVKKITSNSMVWHNPAMNNYYHLKKKK
jgi:hypothetical protein